MKNTEEKPKADETNVAYSIPIEPIFYEENKEVDKEKFKNKNPLVKLSPMWFNKGIVSGVVGSIKYTIFRNLKKTEEKHPDYQLTIASSFVKDLGNGDKEYPKSYQICGMWTQTAKHDFLIGSNKDLPCEYVLLRNEAKTQQGNMPDYFLYVREKFTNH